MSVPKIAIGSGPGWPQQLQADLNKIFALLSAADNRPPRYVKANLPKDDSIRLAIVTDEVGGETLAFFTSTNVWKRVTDNAVVS